MGQKEKLIARLKTIPKDFTFEEAESLLKYLTYRRFNKGKTSGSRVVLSVMNTRLKFCFTNHIPGKNCLSIR